MWSDTHGIEFSISVTLNVQFSGIPHIYSTMQPSAWCIFKTSLPKIEISIEQQLLSALHPLLYPSASCWHGISICFCVYFILSHPFALLFLFISDIVRFSSWILVVYGMLEYGMLASDFRSGWLLCLAYSEVYRAVQYFAWYCPLT